ncbi:MAG: phospholipase D family protein, partial [Candidatus Omnitrophica bacterium]|nr:phospholipase D family protein [Candidatus Omnitrophota bacterium]
MNIEIIDQKPGINSLSKEINDALSKGQYKTFRALIAYISWSGLALVHEKLEAFHDLNKKISLIIGVGDDGSEIDALRYLKQRFSKADIFVFHASVERYKYHPKVYIFSNKKKSLLFIGSNNLTNGGLFCNSECCVKLEIDHKQNKALYNSINEVWKSYANPQAPFSKNNLHRISEKLFAVYPKKVIKKQRIETDRFNKSLNSIFPPIKIPATPKTTLIRQVIRSRKRTRLNKRISQNVLFLEVLKETGAGGTQVQIPREAIEKYFNVPTIGHQTIEIQVEQNAIRPAVICHFLNNTHRISFQEIAYSRRPFLMKFIHKGMKLYSVKFLKGKEYKKEIAKCKNQTRSLAKRW